MAEARRKSQLDKALSDLRNLILSGEFVPGDRLSEPVLADRLDISRTPLREAMSRLVDEGLIERIASGGCRVSSYTMQDIVDAIEVRGAMEGLAARLAAERGPDRSDIEACHVLLSRIDQALDERGVVDFESYVSLNAAFHERVVAMSGSTVVAREVDRVCRLPLASPSAFLHGQDTIPEFRASLLIAQAQHKTVLGAIKAREGARAEAIAREHARLARLNLEYALNPDKNLVARIPGLALVAMS